MALGALLFTGLNLKPAGLNLRPAGLNLRLAEQQNFVLGVLWAEDSQGQSKQSKNFASYL